MRGRWLKMINVKIEQDNKINGKVNVMFALCAYGEVQHPTVSSLVEMTFDFGKFCAETGYGWSFATAFDTLICGAREGCVEAAIKGEYDYIFFIDSDMVFPVNAARKLVERAVKNDYNVVSGLYCTRHAPYRPLIYMGEKDNNGDIKYCQYQPSTYGGVFECDATGLGCCLLKTEIFNKISKPWFRLDSSSDTGYSFSEDVYFFQKANKEMGLRVNVDTSVVCGHMGLPMMVVPAANSPFPKINMPVMDGLAWRESKGIKMVEHETWEKIQKERTNE